MKIAGRVYIGYGSESGNAQALAQRLSEQPFLHNLPVVLSPLNEIALTDINHDDDWLFIICSSFGDGESPANAEQFCPALNQTATLDRLHYAIFGLGDTAYPNFCGFTRQLDARLREKGARPVINRVDADVNYEGFFVRWLDVLLKVLNGDAAAGRDLHLRVVAYDASRAFTAAITHRARLNLSAPGAWRIHLNIADSGMGYRAGDTLYVLAENDTALLESLQTWFNRQEAAACLRHKELRQLGKGALREIARLSGSAELKNLLKISQKKALDAYLYGADIVDVLQDFCTPHSPTLEQLCQILSPCLPRAYSIASPAGDNHIELCIREVSYQRGGRLRKGLATGWLLEQHEARIFARANPGFWLPEDDRCPIIMVGTGTGIAPLLGLLREMAANGERRECVLIFGEKRRDEDFLYQQELLALQEKGTIGRIIPAFSRDGVEKYYVQHAIADHQQILRPLLQQGAHIYLCGNKRHLEESVARAIMTVLDPQDEASARLQWQALVGQKRLHCELY